LSSARIDANALGCLALDASNAHDTPVVPLARKCTAARGRAFGSGYLIEPPGS
jgi:hypothetical protein